MSSNPHPDPAAPALAAGRQARRQGDLTQAIACFREAARINPASVAALNNLATALQAQGDGAGALLHLRQALERAPHRALLHCNLGGLLQLQGDLASAIAAYRQALTLQPGIFLAHFNLGKALAAQEHWEEALGALDAARDLQPNHAALHLERGRVLTRLGRSQAALHAYEQALALDPNSQAYVSLSAALCELRCFALAHLSAAQAIALDPHSAVAYYNRGVALSRMNRCHEALADNLRAIELQADYADAHWNQALNSLLLGDYAPGWQHYEWRWRRTGAAPERYPERPLWTGRESLAGKTILLHAEQGLGDTIQFARYVPLIAERGARVLLEVYPPVAPLFVRLPGVSQLLPYSDQGCSVEFDYQAPLLSLPLALGTTLATLPATTPYVQAPPRRRAHWHKRLGARTRPRIGLVWSGNPGHANDAERSIPLVQMQRLLTPHLDYYSLQRDVRAADQHALDTADTLIHFGEQLRDFSDTAAVIAQLDLVITVDTAVAHLAGALGAPTWILLHYNPDWRWLLERTDSPWYPSVRLFRQPLRDDWTPVLEVVRQHLLQFAATMHPPEAT